MCAVWKKLGLVIFDQYNEGRENYNAWGREISVCSFVPLLHERMVFETYFYISFFLSPSLTHYNYPSSLRYENE